SATQALSSRRVGRGRVCSARAMASTSSVLSPSRPNNPIRLAVNSVWASQYAVDNFISGAGSSAGRSSLAVMMHLLDRDRGRRGGAVHVAFHLHECAAVAHEALPDAQAVPAPDVGITLRDPLEVGTQAIQVLRMIPAAHRP